MAEGNYDKKFANGELVPTVELVAGGIHLIKVCEARQLWVDPAEVAAIGAYGESGTLIVLKGSGKELVAKDISPGEVAQMVAGLISTEEVGR